MVRLLHSFEGVLVVGILVVGVLVVGGFALP